MVTKLKIYVYKLGKVDILKKDDGNANYLLLYETIYYYI